MKTAEKLNAECVQVPAPTIVGSVDVAKAFLAENSIRRALDLSADSEIAVTGIGPVNQDSLLFESGFLTDADITFLKEEKKAVGSVIGRFYDIDGNEVESEFQTRAIALEMEKFLSIPKRIAFAGGATKLDSLIGAVRGKLINTLVTDSQTASALLEAFNSTAAEAEEKRELA